ncbi:hypothetical protein PRZ48_013543 [Zasmidium cellare]|uniref:Uncharacterized protein n=1 Tax=Zasmidium cellare TaxID=395010 RepID=A0ABR0E1D0_ZASCE|nr:hypothetical protein PRZ48_013543 [Zasmidium cellare]
MSQKAEIVGASPPYGPAMSPAIFAEKWFAKFEDLLATKFFHDDKFDMVWLENNSEAAFQHLLHFRAQAVELGLREQDYPEHQPPAFRDVRTPRARAARYCHTNPFFTASALMDMVHPILCRLRELKHGNRICGRSWQQMPLRMRQHFNELLLQVDDAKRAGLWPVSEEQEKLMMEEFRSREELRAATLGLKVR